MSWKQRNQEKMQTIIDLIEEGLPQHLVEKKSGMSTKTFSKFLSEIVLEHLDVIQRWEPLFDLQPLEKFPKSIQQRLLKCRRNPNAECFVRIDWNDDDGSLRLSLYEMEIMNKAVGKNSDENQDHNSGGETVSPSATQLTQELA